MPNRIEAAFAKTRRPLLNIYCTAGYPRAEDTQPMLRTLSDAGVDFIELGMPYSDPLADGEVIQQSGAQALRGGITLARIFEQVAGARPHVEPPIILMGYYNQVLRFGKTDFLDACVDSGVDALILPDLPLEVYEREFREDLERRDIGISFLVTPRTPDERIRRIDALCRGFLYVVSASSTTGSAERASEEQQTYFERLRALRLRSPLLIGFNISTPDSLARTARFAEGGIIGSAFIRSLDPARLAASARDFVEYVRPAIKA